MHGFILRLAEGVFYGFGGNVSAWDKEVYDSGKRPYRARQKLFFANIFNYLELVPNNQYLEIENKLRLIDSSPLPNHYKNINLHNLKLSCSPAHVEFYLGGELKDNTFYFDPRSIW